MITKRLDTDDGLGRVRHGWGSCWICRQRCNGLWLPVYYCLLSAIAYVDYCTKIINVTMGMLQKLIDEWLMVVKVSYNLGCLTRRYILFQYIKDIRKTE